jgi:Ca2+-binding EF-hand superfamily protein
VTLADKKPTAKSEESQRSEYKKKSKELICINQTKTREQIKWYDDYFYFDSDCEEEVNKSFVCENMTSLDSVNSQTELNKIYKEMVEAI